MKILLLQTNRLKQTVSQQKNTKDTHSNGQEELIKLASVAIKKSGTPPVIHSTLKKLV